MKFWISIVMMLGCAKGPGMVRNAGPLSMEKRALPAFEKVAVGQNFALTLVQDTANWALVTYGKNLLPRIKMEVNNGLLTIVDKNAWNWVRKLPSEPKIELHLMNLNYLEISSSAVVTCANAIQVPNLEINIEGSEDQDLWINGGFVIGACKSSGAMRIKGWSNIFSWSCFKSSFVDASKLNGDDAYLFHYTINDCYLNAKEKVGVRIENKGNVFLEKEPVTKYREGLGAGNLLVR